MGNAKKGRKRKSGLEGRKKKRRRRRAKGYRGGRNSGRRTKKDGKSGKESKKKGEATNKDHRVSLNKTDSYHEKRHFFRPPKSYLLCPYGWCLFEQPLTVSLLSSFSIFKQKKSGINTRKLLHSTLQGATTYFSSRRDIVFNYHEASFHIYPSFISSFRVTSVPPMHVFWRA